MSETELKRSSRALDRVTRASLHHPALFLVAAALVFAGSVRLSISLFQDIRSSFQELLPADLPSVKQIQELVQRVGGDGSVLVTVESLQRPANLPAAEALARRLVDDYLALGPEVIRSIEWNVDATRSWYVDHWPLFLSLEQLTEARDALASEVARRKRTANPLSLELEDEPTEAAPAWPKSLGPFLDPKEALPADQVRARFSQYRDGMLVHPDGASVTLNVRPTGTALGVEEARALVARMRRVTDRRHAELERDQLRVGFAGSFPMFVAEYESITGDVRNTALLTLGLVLGSLFLFFRDVRSTVSLGIAVLTGVAVTFALTRLTIGYLNTQTAFLGAIVLGNGINYGIIYLARVRQLRRAGVALEPACLGGAEAAWRATLLASAATSVSFLILVLAANRGFRHFGIIGGMGMLSCWAFTFLLIPALLAVWERIAPVPRSVAPDAEPTVPRFLGSVFARPGAILVGFGILTLASGLLFVSRLSSAIERNLDNLANELRGHDTLLRDHDRAGAALGKSISGAIALLGSREEADAFCDSIRGRLGDPRYREVIEGCTTVSSVVPRDQAPKLERIRDIARRLSDAVLEKLPEHQRQRAESVRRELLAQEPLSLGSAPPSLLDRFRERDGTVGRLAVVTARPDAFLQRAPRLEAFVEGVRDVPVGGRTVDASGENVIFSDLLQDIDREGPLTTVLSLVGVCLLVALFLRDARTSAEVIATLVCGVVLMAGIASLVGLRINFLNFIVYPITFGIAVDYGANVALRTEERGGDVLRGLREVGPAVILCSWTTIIGYGSLVIASNRALRSFGWYALLGEVACLVTALVMLPAFLLIAGRRKGAAGRTSPATARA